MESSLDRAVPRPRPRGARAAPNVHVAAQAPLVQLEPTRRRGAAERRAGRVLLPEAREPRPTGAAERCCTRSSSDSSGSCSATTSPPPRRRDRRATSTQRCARPRLRLRSWCRVSTGCSSSSPTCARSPGRATTRPTPTGAGCAARRSTCTRTCARSTPEAEGLPDRVRRAARARRSRTTASRSSSARRALEEACYRLFLSQQRAERTRAAVVAILDRRLERGRVARRTAWATTSATALDRLAAATEGRDPVAGRSRPRGALPLLRRAADRRGPREQPTRQMEEHIAALAEDPERAGRASGGCDALVDCPRPLAPLLTGRMRDGRARAAAARCSRR